MKEREKDTPKQQTSAGIPKGVTKINKLYKKVEGGKKPKKGGRKGR